MKPLYASIILLVLFTGCNGTDDITINVKQIIPLTPTTFIEVSMPLNTNQSFESFHDKLLGIENKIEENKTFAIPIQIENKNETYYNTKLRLSYNPEYVTVIYPYWNNKQPMKMIDANTFYFDDELTPFSTSKILLVGRTRVLEDIDYVEDMGVRFEVTILGNGGSEIKTITDKLRIINADS